jgi:DNA-binding response OmpR family regulator
VTKVAIVEDDTQIRQMLEIAIQHIGLEVVSAGDGKRGLDVILRERPQVAILDVMMPGMSGFELCHAAKQLMGARAPYVIILTAKGQPTDVMAGRAHGADLYLIKPVDMGKLLDHVKKAISADTPSAQIP